MQLHSTLPCLRISPPPVGRCSADRRKLPSLSVGTLQHLLSQRCVLRGEDDLLGAGSVFHRQLHQQLHIFLTGQLRQLLPGLSEGIVDELLLAGEELLPAGAVGAALGSPLILLGITGGLFLIRLAQLPGLAPRTSP